MLKRIYEDIIVKHYSLHNEAIFLSGPRQVGKTTISEAVAKNFDHTTYLNWDNTEDRHRILEGNIPLLKEKVLGKSLVTFDEIHKFDRWKTYLKGLFDHHKNHISFLVTGSSRLNVYRQGGDSMMGRYFLYRAHPLSVGELLNPSACDTEIKAPLKISDEYFEALIDFGGFPKPYTAANVRFYNRWKNQRLERLFEEDIRDTLRIQEAAKIQVLANILAYQAGFQVNYTNLSKSIQVADQTIRTWITYLESFYYCFTIKPWSSNVARSLVKEPIVYLWDWASVANKGMKHQNLIASHLLKAVHFWTDEGFGLFELWYLRDQQKNEVDFLVTKDNQPWLMVEVKSSFKEPLSKSLYHFQNQLKAPYCFQVGIDGDYIDEDCFNSKNLYAPLKVPARTFLSQLV